MSVRLTIFALLLLICGAFPLKAQMSYHPPVHVVLERLEILGAGQPDSQNLNSTVVMDIKVYIESEVKLEIRNALGHKLFESMAVYPEGNRQVKVRLGDMEQGLYFVKVSTDLDAQTEMVIVEK
jgi:hypothetical protein